MWVSSALLKIFLGFFSRPFTRSAATFSSCYMFGGITLYTHISSHGQRPAAPLFQQNGRIAQRPRARIGTNRPGLQPTSLPLDTINWGISKWRLNQQERTVDAQQQNVVTSGWIYMDWYKRNKIYALWIRSQYSDNFFKLFSSNQNYIRFYKLICLSKNKSSLTFS
jgi:hypothetical protein